MQNLIGLAIYMQSSYTQLRKHSNMVVNRVNETVDIG